MTEERYLVELVDSYKTIIELQKEKIDGLEKELVDLKKSRQIEDPFKERYDWINNNEDKPAIIPTKEDRDLVIHMDDDKQPKPEFGSMSNRIKIEASKELKKTEATPTPVVHTTVNKKDDRPRPWKRFIYFKSKQDALNFVDRYSNDFEVGKTKKTYWNASLTRFEVKRNTSNNDLFANGYLFVLEFSMNGVDFKALEDLENLVNYKQSEPGKKGPGGSFKSIRLYNGEKAKVG